jgi:acetolactate synthase-1/2/3 large subunit
VNGAQVAIEALRREGVRHLVGLPGTTIMHLIDAAGQAPGVRYLSARHEQVAAFMADGYARASGGPGVCLASRGPGAANLAIGMHNAHAESIPVLALVGQVPDQISYREAFEEMDLVRFFDPITKWSLEIHQPDRIAELVQRAVRTALSGRPGPVMVSLPLDAQIAGAAARYQASARPLAPAPPPGAAQAAVARLAAARRPVIIVGGGLRGPGYDAGLARLASGLHIPVVTTWLRKNVFPNDSPLFCGSLGYGILPATEELVRGADLVLAIGCRFSEFTTARWTLPDPGTALIQVDIDPDALGRYYLPEIGICADAAAATAAMAAAADALAAPAGAPAAPGGGAAPPASPPAAGAAALAGREDEGGWPARLARRRAWAAAVRGQYRQQAALPAPPPGAPQVSSAALVGALRTVLGATPATLVQDAPSLGTWIQRHLDFTTPDRYYASGGGAMGWGFPAALGMQLARPQERFITVSGDGSFWMVAQDLETAVREDLPVVTVISNNFAFGNTRDRQASAHGGRYLGVFYGNPDFAEFARLLGGHGERVETGAQLVPALERALASGKPAVVDVIQDPHEGLPPGLLPPAAR